MIVDGYVYKAVPKFIPVREKKGDPLRMERCGWQTDGCPLAKITFHDSTSRDNPVLTMLRESGMIVSEQTKGY